MYVYWLVYPLYRWSLHCKVFPTKEKSFLSDNLTVIVIGNPSISYAYRCAKSGVCYRWNNWNLNNRGSWGKYSTRSNPSTIMTITLRSIKCHKK